MWEFLKNSTKGVVRQEEERSGGDGEKIKLKLSEVNTRAVSRGQRYRSLIFNVMIQKKKSRYLDLKFTGKSIIRI